MVTKPISEKTGLRQVQVDEKVAFLSRAENYPIPADTVLVKETHMSWVFLINGFVYKMKKPVCNSMLDHRTLELRLVDCMEEVRLNQKMAPGIYLGVVSLNLNKKGALSLEGEGEPVEWLVKMKRIPGENLLDFAIKNKVVNSPDLLRAARLLIEFYKGSTAASLDTLQLIKKLERDISETFEHLKHPVFGLPPSLLGELYSGQIAFLNANYNLFNERVRNNKVIEIHGDLRPEHICLKPEPAFIDRLEFNLELRIADVAEELALLSMECEMMGNRGAGNTFLDEYIRITNDEIPSSLTRFYTIKKACLRAYLVARHVEEDRYKDEPKWLVKANAYTRLAEKYLQEFA